MTRIKHTKEERREVQMKCDRCGIKTPHSVSFNVHIGDWYYHIFKCLRCGNEWKVELNPWAVARMKKMEAKT